MTSVARLSDFEGKGVFHFGRGLARLDGLPRYACKDEKRGLLWRKKWARDFEQRGLQWRPKPKRDESSQNQAQREPCGASASPKFFESTPANV